MPSTADILKKVRQVEIRTNRMVTEAMSGAYHSAFKGQGIDFEEVREYAPGDDVRAIDWNVTARMDRPFVKLFKEERELTIMLLVDCSASGLFGSTENSKRELAAELASVLAFSAIRNNDKVGTLLFTDQVEEIIIPKKGRNHVLRLIRDILFFTPKHTGTDILDALDHANRVLRRHSIVFLLSDFLQMGKQPEALYQTLTHTARRHDLTCIHLMDTREQVLPDVGIVALEDAETGEVIELNTSKASVRKKYEAQNKERTEKLHRSLRQTGAGILPVQTDQDYITPLRNYFALRKKP